MSGALLCGMGSVEQSTGGGMGDLNSRGGSWGGRRGGRGSGGEVGRSRGSHANKPGEQYEKRSYNRNNRGGPHNNNNRNKDIPIASDIYQQSTPSPEELEFDEEQLALQEQIQLHNKVC